MIHRHLRFRDNTTAENLPAAAIVDILERGDLDAWQPIAAAVARDPYGAFAERVAHLLDSFPMYGTSPLWRMWIDRCRARDEGRWKASPPETLSALRRRVGLTQVELAGRLGMSQSDLSKLERRADVRISTLRSYVEALGGTLRIVFVAGRAHVDLRLANRS